MGKNVILYGKSGSGKSASLRNFNEDEIFLVNVTQKDLPIRKKFKYEWKSDSVTDIIEALKKMPMKIAVIDDETFVMVNNFMRKHGRKEVNQFDLFNEIANGMFNLFQAVQNLPDDVIVYHVLHEDKSDNYGIVKIRTIGKLLDDKCPLEALVTICIRCMCDGTKHYFTTQTDGYDITKSPMDMFQDAEIDNDLKFVDTAIREYYGLNKETKKEKEKK